MRERYKLVRSSLSAHCCFVGTVIDTDRPHFQDNAKTVQMVVNGELLYESICEVFDERDGEKIVQALNLLEKLRS